jgi:hypothetical protein
VPALLSSPVQVPEDQSGEAIAADPAGRSCLADWLSRVPDTRSGLGRWHPLTFVLGLAVCAMTSVGVDSVTAIGEWAADCSQQTLQALGGRLDPFRRRYRAPSIRTFGRVLAGIDIEAFNAAAYGFLHEWAGRAGRPDPASPLLDEITQAGREQRRAVARARAAARQPDPADRQEPALLPAVAGDGKVARGAVRPDGARMNLLSVMDTATGTTLTQREIPAKTNEIPELAPAIAHLDLAGKVVTLDALHTQVQTARHLAEDKHAHYLLIVKGNQPTLHATIAGLLAGPDTDFPTDITDGRGHGRRERRTVRTALADTIDFPHAGQVFRIRRDRGELHGPWTSKEIVYGITDLGPRPGRTHPDRHLRTPALGHRESHPLRAGRHLRRGCLTGQDRQPAPRPGHHPQPDHQHIPPHRTRQHRPRAQTPRPRRPPNPRSLRIQTSGHSIGQITNSPGPWLNIVYEIADDFAAEVTRLCQTQVSDAEWAAFLDAHAPIPEDKGRARTMAETKRETLTRLWNHDNRVAPWHGTAWGVVQAVNTYTHHEQTVRGAGRVERNMLRAVTGGVDELDHATLQTLNGVRKTAGAHVA